MVQTIYNWKTVLTKVKSDYPTISPSSHKFKVLAASAAETLELADCEVTQLALHFGCKWYQRPKNVPRSWKLLFCKTHLSQKYVDPTDSSEYVLVKQPDMSGGLPYIIHRTKAGFADARWFYEVLPDLDKLLKAIFNDPKIRFPFTEDFNAAVNAHFEKSRNGLGMTQGQVHAFNLFFEKHVPELEGICTKCFKVSLPHSWAGERWSHRSNEKFEIRLSAAKPHARYDIQKVEYVTHTELDRNRNEIHAAWDKTTKTARFDSERVQKDTHIPWDVYDFNKFQIGMPVCTCLKKP